MVRNFSYHSSGNFSYRAKDLPVVLRKFIQIKNGIKNYVNSFQKGIDDIVQEQEKDIKKIIDINPEEKNKKKPENT